MLADELGRAPGGSPPRAMPASQFTDDSATARSGTTLPGHGPGAASDDHRPAEQRWRRWRRLGHHGTRPADRAAPPTAPRPTVAAEGVAAPARPHGPADAGEWPTTGRGTTGPPTTAAPAAAPATDRPRRCALGGGDGHGLADPSRRSLSVRVAPVPWRPLVTADRASPRARNTAERSAQIARPVRRAAWHARSVLQAQGLSVRSAAASSSRRPTSPSCPATRSASSAATAPARPACSRCSAARPSPRPAGCVRKGGFGYLPQDPRIDGVADDAHGRHPRAVRAGHRRRRSSASRSCASPWRSDPTSATSARYTRAEEAFRRQRRLRRRERGPPIAAGLGLADRSPRPAPRRAVGRRAPPGRAGPHPVRRQRRAAASTSRPTTSTSTPRSGCSASCAATAGRCWSSATTSTCSTRRSPGCSTSTGPTRTPSAPHRVPGHVLAVPRRPRAATRCARPSWRPRQAKEIARHADASSTASAPRPPRRRWPTAWRSASPASRPNASTTRRRRKVAASPVPDAAAAGRTVLEAAGLAKVVRRPADLRGRRLRRRPRRAPARARPQRRRQDEPAAHPRRRDRRRPRAPSSSGHDVVGRLLRPGARQPAPGASLLDHIRARCRPASSSPRRELRGLLGMFGLAGEKVVPGRRHAVRRREDQAGAGHAGGRAQQPAAARRADQQPRPAEPRSRSPTRCRDWPGAMVLVSHDTEFVEQLAPDQVLLMPDGERRLLQRRPGSTWCRSPDTRGPPATWCGRCGAVDVVRWGDGVARRRPRAPAQAVAVLERRVPGRRRSGRCRVRRCGGWLRPTLMRVGTDGRAGGSSPRPPDWSVDWWRWSRRGRPGASAGIERGGRIAGCPETVGDRRRGRGGGARRPGGRRADALPRRTSDAFGSGFPQAACGEADPADCFSVEQYLDLLLGGSDTRSP